ncbi:MAG: type II secretion system F family protein [Corynebacterium sp.]|nr:type II secretion system F family protein [Corynebacterium sp.]
MIALSPLSWLFVALAVGIGPARAAQRVQPPGATRRWLPAPTRRWLPALSRLPTRSADATPLSSGDIDLFAGCITAGLSPAQAAQAVGGPGWSTLASLLAQGIPAAQAWGHVCLGQPETSGWHALATVATAADHTGASMAAECQRVAESQRAEAGERRLAAAQRAGVLIALPLTLCFLPAFVLVGLVPVLITLGATMF